jgi:hypothetical protein
MNLKAKIKRFSFSVNKFVKVILFLLNSLKYNEQNEMKVLIKKKKRIYTKKK